MYWVGFVVVLVGWLAKRIWRVLMGEGEGIRGKRVRIRSEFPVPTVLWGREGTVVTCGLDGVHRPENPWVVVTVGEDRYQLRVSELEVIGDV